MAKPTSTLTGTKSFLSRPYAGLGNLQDALQHTQLVAAGARYQPGSVSLPVEELPLRGASIEIYLDVDSIMDALDALEIPRDSVKLACVAYGSVIAASEKLLDVPIVEVTSPRVVELAGNPFIFESPTGFDARVMLYLADRLAEGPLRPHIPGTWFAHTNFHVVPESALSQFSPTPLDDVLRGQLGLPVECLTYIRAGDDLLNVSSLDEAVDVFVDVNVLRILQDNQDSPLAQFMQLELAKETILTVLTKAEDLLAEGSGPSLAEVLNPELRGIGALLRRIAAVGNMTSDELVAVIRQDPGYVGSLVQVAVNSLKTTSLLLREVS